MSANQQSVMSSSLESKVDVEMSLDDHSGKNEVSESKIDSKKPEAKVEEPMGLGLDDDSEQDLITIHLIDRKLVPVFYTTKKGDNVKVEFKLARKEFEMSEMLKAAYSDKKSADENESIPISMSWATGANPNENPYTNDDAAYSLYKCVEWMRHYKGFNIGIVGEIPGTPYKISLRASSYWCDLGLNYKPTDKLEDNMKVMDHACRGLDSRTSEHLAVNVRRKLVREKLLKRIRELKGMPEDTYIDEKTANKLIYEKREEVERESPHIKWVEKMLEETTEEEEKYFKENPPWFLTWVKEICDNGTLRQLTGVMSCASYLGIKPLVSLCGAMIATMMKHKVKKTILAEIQMREAREPARVDF